MSQLIEQVLRKFESGKIVFISDKELPQLLEGTQILMEEDTLMSDYIRILRADNNTFLIQEKSPKNEIILRMFSDESAARNFVSARMKIYDKMWDGCGCKVDYYS
jgi:hypothetical protein